MTFLAFLFFPRAFVFQIHKWLGIRAFGRRDITLYTVSYKCTACPFVEHYKDPWTTLKLIVLNISGVSIVRVPTTYEGSYGYL